MSAATAPAALGRPRAGGFGLLGDDRLVRLAAAGNRPAFAALYERHHQGLYRYCYSILGNPEDAADALQNTMLCVWRALRGERRKIAVKPWLYRIARNESISLLRRRRPQVQLEQAPDLEVPSTEGEAAGRARLEELVSDLRELPEGQRGALVMRELGGLGYGEIGEAFEISPAAARQAVHEARSSLHELSEGRDLRCEEIRRVLSTCDGRARRERKLRAHLRCCAGCRDFQAAAGTRQRSLGALLPLLPARSAEAILDSVLGAMSASGGGGLAAALLGAGKALIAPVAVKGIAAVAAVSVGAGAISLATAPPAPRHAEAPRPAPAAPAEALATAFGENARVGGAPAPRSESDAEPGPAGSDGEPPARAPRAPNGASRGRIPPRSERGAQRQSTIVRARPSGRGNARSGHGAGSRRRARVPHRRRRARPGPRRDCRRPSDVEALVDERLARRGHEARPEKGPCEASPGEVGLPHLPKQLPNPAGLPPGLLQQQPDRGRARPQPPRSARPGPRAPAR